ncbi:MAG: hypothetical protein F4X40_09695, partial [Chloroflexi bacterium]|nr:hypothetical protein [Chloroflexota bacterium]
MPSIIISSVSESKGKSALAAAIISRLRHDGVSVRSVADTGDLFAGDDGVDQIEIGQIEPSGSSVSIIEGATGDPETDFNIAEQVDANVILLAGIDDDVNDAVKVLGDRLAGVVLNKVARYRDVHADRMVGSLAKQGINCIGWIPEDRRLAASTVDTVIDHLEGELAFEIDTTSELVDNVLIGGLVLDWGPFYFRSQDNTCVVVRAGRPDVQISALQSDTTRAMVLTGGEKPIDYVFYEARTKRIPLIMVGGDTHATMDALDEMEPTGF